MAAASRTRWAIVARAPWPGPTALITRGQPSAAAARHDSSNTPSKRSSSAPSAYTQPTSTPTHATPRPEARTQPRTSSSVLPASRARRKSTRRNSTASQPVRRAIVRASASGVESSVQVWSASGWLTWPPRGSGQWVAEGGPADSRDGLRRVGPGRPLRRRGRLRRRRRLGLGGCLLRRRLLRLRLLRDGLLGRLLLFHGAESTPIPARRSTRVGRDGSEEEHGMPRRLRDE